MPGDTERAVRAFCAWWATRGHDATTAESERIARELLDDKGPRLSRSDVDAYCAKLKRGFAGGRTILAANEVGEALVEWLQSTGGGEAGAALDGEDLPGRSGTADDGGPVDEISWGESTGDELLAGVNVDDLPPIPDELPPLEDGSPLPAPDMSFGETDLPSLDERVDAIGGRDVFAGSNPPPDDAGLELDLDADMIGRGDKAHYVREEEMEVRGLGGGLGGGLNVDVDPDAPNARTDDVLDLGALDGGLDGDMDVPDSLKQDIPESRASAAPVGRISSGTPPPADDDAPADQSPHEGLPALTTPPPAARSTSPLVIGLGLVLLIAAAAAATFAL